MLLRVKSIEKLIFEGEVYGFSARAKDGEFVCLDKHADYLSVLDKGELYILDDKLKRIQTINLDRDFILLLENNIAAVFC